MRTRGTGAMAAIVASLVTVNAATAVTVVRGPYLQTPTTTSMIIRWRTDLPANSRVSYGSAPTMLDTTVDNPAPTTEHSITLTGLAPDTEYFYAVAYTGGTLAGEDSDHFFRTAPTTGSSTPFRIWTIGDAGFPGPNLNAVRDAFAAYNGSSATDLFLLLGDNAYLLGTDAQYQAALFSPHANMLRTTPVYSTFGNHERFSSLDLAQTGPYFDMFTFPAAGEAGGMASGTEAYYSFDYANVHFVVLDSEDNTPTSSSSPMLTWLDADLAGTTADWVIAFWHRPPYSRGLLHNSDVEVNEVNMRQFVLPILDSYGVDLVLSGHSHNYERSYFIDGHYGLSGTFSDAFKKDLGNGDPTDDGAYQKSALGQVPNSGAVYAVNGSGSEVRNVTLNHPAHVIGILKHGSMVIDINANILTARFLTSAGAIEDQFQIVKGTTCPPVPAAGCLDAVQGKVTMKNYADPAKNKWSWKWKGGTVDGAVFGEPAGGTDLAMCLYDQAGTLAGGILLHGAAEWSISSRGMKYLDKLRTRHGIQKIGVKFDTGTNGKIQAKAKGPGVGVPTIPAAFPLTAQLINLGTGACWESVFTTAKRNEDGRITANFP